MQSKTSYFNGTLFRKNLTRFWPLWGMASFLGCLVPLAAFLQFAHGWRIEPLEITTVYYTVLCYWVPVVSLVYAVLCAMMVWSYLYSARSVGLMHALPIRREGLFLTNFLSGLAMLLIPYAATGALCVLITLAFGAFEPVGLLVTILGVLGDSFFYFATATFAAFIVGNVFALPAVYFLLHFLAVLLEWLLNSFASGFIFGLVSSYSGAAAWLSPTVYLMGTLYTDETYAYVKRVDDITGAPWTDSVLSSVTLKNAWVIGAYALAGVVFLALAYALYRRRRSESAGDVVAVGWMKPVFRFGVAALASLLGGRALYALFWESFQTGETCDAVPMTVCMIVAGVIGYYLASMLLAKSPRVFRGSWKGVLPLAVACAALCAVLRFDVLGVSARVPEISEVKEVELYVANNDYTFYPGEEDDLLEQVRAVHRAIAADADYIRGGYRAYVDDDAVGSTLSTYNYVRLTYTLASGRTVIRQYSLPLTRDRMDTPGTYDYLLDRLVNSEAMKAKRLHLNDSRYTASYGSLYVERSNEGFDLGSREAAAILEAVGKDAAAGAWGAYDWFGSDDGAAYALHLELAFSYKAERGTATDWINITVRPGMDNTVACLKDLDLVTEADLVTNAELYPEHYGEEYPEEEPAYDAAALAEYVPADTESYVDPGDADVAPAGGLGVISGADGPTKVYVGGAV